MLAIILSLPLVIVCRSDANVVFSPKMKAPLQWSSFPSSCRMMSIKDVCVNMILERTSHVAVMIFPKMLYKLYSLSLMRNEGKHDRPVALEELTTQSTVFKFRCHLGLGTFLLLLIQHKAIDSRVYFIIPHPFLYFRSTYSTMFVHFCCSAWNFHVLQNALHHSSIKSLSLVIIATQINLFHHWYDRCECDHFIVVLLEQRIWCDGYFM